MLSAALSGTPATPSAGPPSSAQGGGVQVGNSTATEILITGVLLKAGDDNSRWKKRYFQLVSTQQAPAQRVIKLQYFENDRDAARNRPPRGELLIENMLGLALLGKLPQTDPAVASCVSLTSEHVQDGPLKLMIWGKDRLWRLSEQTADSVSVVSELVRNLDRCRLIPKVALRAVGWMRAQGTLTWNRRYAMLFSTGDLLLFKDSSLEHLRRCLDLSKAFDIRPMQPLAPAGSQAEKRLVRMLAFSTSGSWDNESNLDALELVGIRLRHPDIPEKRGYVMCVETSPLQPGVEYDAPAHYTRFRKWVVQLQLSAAEARLSGYASSREVGVTKANLPQMPQVASDGDDAGLERRLFQVVQSSAHPLASREGALNVAIPYLIRFGCFPPLWRSSLWLVLSGGASLKKNLAMTYSSLIVRDSPKMLTEKDRLLSALLRLDPQLVVHDVLHLVDLFLQFGGEESCFWTVASMTCSLTASSPLNSLQAFFHSGFARFVESRVVLDLLALKHPNVVAHISAYDLSAVLLERCAQFIAGCDLPSIWDAVAVWGKDAMTFGLVALLSSKQAAILECFSRDELERCLEGFTVEKDEAAFWRWSEFDARVVDQVRRAQWTSLIETIRDHSDLISSWRSLAEESKSFGSKSIQQFNRILSGFAPSLPDTLAAPGRIVRSVSNESTGSGGKSSRGPDVLLVKAGVATLTQTPGYSGVLKAVPPPMESPPTFGGAIRIEENADYLFDLAHQRAVEVIALASAVLELSTKIEAALDREVLQTTTGATVKSTSPSNPSHSAAGKSQAVALVPLIERLFAELVDLGRIVAALAWKRWCDANRYAFTHSRFIPKASIRSKLGNSVLTGTNSSAVAGHSGGLILETSYSPPQQQLNSPTTSSTFFGVSSKPAGGSLREASFMAAGLGTNASSSAGAASPGMEEPSLSTSAAGDSSSLKSLAIGLGKRLFQQRFMGSVASNVLEGGDRERKDQSKSASSDPTPRMPQAGAFTEDSPLALFLKFRGGFVGLCEQAGSQTDVDLVREAMLRDSALMRALDEANVLIKISAHCERLARWMLSKDPLVPLSDVPDAFRHLFIPQQVVFNKDNLQSLGETIAELSSRALCT